jgi:hypothetical protein
VPPAQRLVAGELVLAEAARAALTCVAQADSKTSGRISDTDRGIVYLLGEGRLNDSAVLYIDARDVIVQLLIGWRMIALHLVL